MTQPDPYRCCVCGTPYPVRTLARDCEAHHNHYGPGRVTSGRTPVMNVDLDKATEAGAEALAKFLGNGPLTIQDTDRFSNGAAGMIIAAAYPHVLAAVVEALKARAERDGDAAYAAWQRAELGTSGPDHDAQKACEDAYGAAAWLARIAQEGKA